MTFVSKFKQEYKDSVVSYFSELDCSLKERISEEVAKGFDTRDEMNEVFLEIADELNVSPDDVWSTYYDGDWK